MVKLKIHVYAKVGGQKQLWALTSDKRGPNNCRSRSRSTSREISIFTEPVAGAEKPHNTALHCIAPMHFYLVPYFVPQHCCIVHCWTLLKRVVFLTLERNESRRVRRGRGSLGTTALSCSALLGTVKECCILDWEEMRAGE